ncbi:glutaredoxin 2 [Neisseria zalophi]|uniref:Glutaredoxin 2 n=1 Tax=Neisseria zalophi TaxID=640030 RepID=A0A5J6PU91_9NEIS|nr:glutaredoxin 2 [Neisseria zalophi]QEY25926.1 glutaredoxin 2 [Neisseria zalophi]
MKLYIYDHCPFCIRARMVAGFHHMNIENIILQNDDEATPISMIGAKQVPILQKDDGSYMGESLDIVRYLDEQAGKGRLNEDIRPEIQTWFDNVSKYVTRLVHPRDVLVDMPEFATQSAIDYFVRKKEKNIGSFQENLDNTDEYMQKINADLAELEKWIVSPEGLNGTFSMEDILIFPILCILTIVRGLTFPTKTQAYIDRISKMTNVPLFTDKAI